MKPPNFEYFAPTELAEVMHLLDESPNARLLAGGQSLMPMLNMRFLFPDRVIDLNRVSELDYIRESDGEVRVGAMTRQRTLQRSDVILGRMPVIPRALLHVGHVQTRNRGTIGGSLCQLDPSAELPALAAAYDATLEIAGSGNTRVLQFHDFPSFFMTPAIEPNEVLVAVRFKPWSGRVGYGFREFSRRHGDFALGGAIAMLSVDATSTINRVSLTLFGIAAAPVRAHQVESFLMGERIDQHLIREAGKRCVELATLDDAYGSASYRGHIASAMAERAIAEASAEIGIEGVYG